MPRKDLEDWKKLRNKISNESNNEEKLLLNVNYWAKMPFVNYVLDWDRPDSWLTPWEIINDGYYDDIALCIMMSETLCYSNYAEPVELWFILNDDNSRFMVVHTDNKILNYSYNEIIEYNNIKDKIKIIERFKRNEEGKYHVSE